MLISLAWKNIWRNKVRSGIMMMAILLGLTGGMFISAINVGMMNQRIQSAIENEVSNLQVHNPHFLLEKELADTISDVANIIQTLESNKDVKAVASRIKITGMAQSAAKASGITIMGVDPDKEMQVTGLYKFVPDSMGTFFGEEKKNAVVIGNKLAEELKVGLRSKLILLFQTERGEVTQEAFRITGIFKTKNSAFDQTTVFVRDKELAAAIGFSSFKSHEIAVALRNDSSNNSVVQSLTRQFPSSKTESWKKIMPELGMMADSANMMLYVLMIIILAALFFGIVNTMMMSVLERTRELGMLMALGLSKGRLFRLIMLESVLLSLTGALMGMLFSYGLIRYYDHYGFDLSKFASGMEKIGYDAIIHPSLDVEFYVVLTILVFITGIVSAVFPVSTALRLKPVVAIRVF